MTKELRRLSIIVLFMFLALFASTSVIQVLQANTLADMPQNRRTLFDSYETQRGAIVAGDSEIATSVPSEDLYAWQREYLDSPMWSHITGYLNPVLQSADGIERVMGQELAGTAGSAFFSRLDQIVTGQPPRGSNVMLSLDPAVQQAAYDALAGLTGAVLAIEPDTGRILAMVSTPGYDANSLAQHDSEGTNTAYDGLLADASQPLQNRAIAGDLNPPGSTFKVVVAAAALASGDYDEDSELPNPSSYRLPQSSNTVHNANGGTCGGGDTVSIADALRLSCNVPFAELAVELGDEPIREMAERFGFNHEFSTPLAATPSSYPDVLDSDAQVALTGFGQGQLTATPLQIAMVSAGIANGGTVMNPYMVDEIVGVDLSVQQSFSPSEFGQAVDADLAELLTSMMVANVQDGAASGARIDGVDVAGKTGTAENGGDEPYTLWFTGFAPADDPEIAVAVVVEDGGGQGQSGSGNTIAAPIAKKVMEAVLSR
ncbi:peptidoglycan D,D-transpeptidase FtsI family protein [Microbacterium marinilacus]|uniref:Penicillin-binding transpeptidase domain-containing protein n=1 Tax=Microbacterium marinilacus TaxID=415209 RepID=A0ABP7BLZ4_9MICO|nr:penicillin-binding transpeptidase domain-containing protein [Microbacterium marinilacus]MBY0688412.1 penicillin-binding protein 2 [Microbacterium marinilacus]